MEQQVQHQDSYRRTRPSRVGKEQTVAREERPQQQEQQIQENDWQYEQGRQAAD